MLCLPTDLVVRLHKILEPKERLVDRRKLEAALGRPLHGDASGNLFYSTIPMQAGALLHGLLQAHPFTDGNKRVAWLSTVIYLSRNGLHMSHFDKVAAADFVLEVVEHRWAAEDVGLLLTQQVGVLPS